MRDKHIPEYLIGTPKLGDFLEEGLAQLGYSLEDFKEIAYELTVTEVSPMKAEYRLPAGQVQEREPEARC
jgi:hypothetical protein